MSDNRGDRDPSGGMQASYFIKAILRCTLCSEFYISQKSFLILNAIIIDFKINFTNDDCSITKRQVLSFYFYF